MVRQESYRQILIGSIFSNGQPGKSPTQSYCQSTVRFVPTGMSDCNEVLRNVRARDDADVTDREAATYGGGAA
jgi:hypothetical protein